MRPRLNIKEIDTHKDEKTGFTNVTLELQNMGLMDIDNF